MFVKNSLKLLFTFFLIIGIVFNIGYASRDDFLKGFADYGKSDSTTSKINSQLTMQGVLGFLFFIVLFAFLFSKKNKKGNDKYYENLKK